jgi:hypothetical protein
MNGSSQAASGTASRQALLGTGWVAFLFSVVGRPGQHPLPIPNVVYEADGLQDRQAGGFPVGTTTFLEDRRVFIFHESQGFRAVSAICTHLRCTTVRSCPPTDTPGRHSTAPATGAFSTKPAASSGSGPAAVGGLPDLPGRRRAWW